MKLAICWTGLSGYMAACWRALAQRPGVALRVVCFAPDARASNAAFDPAAVDDIPCRLLTPGERQDAGLIEDEIAGFHPDVVMLTGWAHRPYRRLVNAARLRQTRFVMAMDTPWRGDWRQTISGPFIRQYMSRMAAVFVAGERARQYALRRGVSPTKIFRGMYAYDDTLFNEQVFLERLQKGWPKRFLFTGRYVETKGVDDLLAAYALYRRQHESPWSLDCCGLGPKQSAIRAVDGVSDLGFVQPHEQPGVLAGRGAFILPSRYEPWGVVLAEAMASGLPVIATSACGAAADVLHPFFNGLEVPANDPPRLAAAMSWMHARHERLAAMGRHAMGVAPAFSATLWAEKVEAMCQAISGRPSSIP
jgi:glycosyltransferase involved in cell wall biosynthesis